MLVLLKCTRMLVTGWWASGCAMCKYGVTLRWGLEAKEAHSKVNLHFASKN